jgi:hypothetical protein
MLVVCACLVAWPTLSLAWWVKGHETITTAATAGMPADVPAFFRAGPRVTAHCAGDPDRWKNKDTPQLAVAEAPDHFLDLENFGGHDLPADRYQAIALLFRLGQKPERTGMLPYAIAEHFDRLTVAFFDYRQAPDNEAARMKCLVYAGVLSHYTGDLAMPLHTTRDYDGRPGTDGQLMQRGIHARIDSFPERQGFTAEEIGRGLEAHELSDVPKHIRAMTQASHAQVDRCYALDVAEAFERPTAESRAFILERCRAAAQLTLDLYYTAWKRSARLRAPF